MKKRTAKLTALLLVSMAMFSAGLQNVSAEEAAQDNVGGLQLPLCDEKQELTVFMVWDNDFVEDPNDLPAVQAMEERTNVHINWITYGQTEMLEKFTLTLGTGEYADIMFPGGTNSYPGGYMAGVDEGVLIDMDEYTQYMPNYMALLNSNDEAMRQAVYDDGKLHSLRVIKGTDKEVKATTPIFGPTYRADILDEMGEELPTTIDEWHDLLIKCRDRGMTAPMTLESDGGTSLSLAWGVNTDWSSGYWQYDPDSGKVQYGPLTEGFEPWLTTMADWYKEDLIDKNFTAGSAIITGDYTNIENANTMLFDIWFGFMNGQFLYQTGAISDENCYMQAFDGAVLEEGDEVIKCAGEEMINKCDIFVTTECEDPELAAKWLDYQCSEEGIMYRYYGIEGDTYTIDDTGEIVFTDKVLHDPDGLSLGQAISKVALQNYMVYENNQANERYSLASSPDGRSASIESGQIWASPSKSIHIPFGVQLNTEEQEIYDTYMTDITTYVQEYMVKTIIGESTVPYEEFAASLENYGIQEVIDVYQQATDRYMNR